MDDEEINFGIKEYSRTRDIFTEIALQSLLQSDTTIEQYLIKKLDLFIGLTTISVAFLAIVVPFIKQPLPVILIFVIALFLITSVCGILLSINTIRRKTQIIKEDADRKHTIFNNYIITICDIISGMQDYKKYRKNKTFETVKNKMEELENSRKKLHIDDKKWYSDKKKECLAIVLKYLETIFWVAFSFAGILFIIWIFQTTLANIK